MLGCGGTIRRLVGSAVLLAAAASSHATLLAADTPAAKTSASSTPAAKLTVTRLTPSGATAGGTLVVKAEGTFPRWPVQVWTDRGGTTWTPRDDRGTFTVTTAATSVGMHRVRIHDDREAAAVHRFVVGTLPEIPELEPNDRPQTPQAIASLPVTINGVLEKAGAVDAYGVTLEAGQTLVAAVDARATLAAPVDAVLELVDDRGNYLARNLDAHGLDPRIVFKAARSGRHVLRVYGFPSEPTSTIGYSGGANHVYRLTLTTGGFVATTLPAAVSRTGTTAVAARGWNLPADLAAVPLVPAPEDESVWVSFPGVAGTVELPVVSTSRLPIVTPDRTAPAVTAPLVASGLFTAARQELVLRLTAKTSEPLLVGIEATSIGAEAEATLDIRAADGGILLSKSDRNPPAMWTPPQDGGYLLSIKDRRGSFGPSHVFRLSIAAPGPTIAASSDSDMLAGKAGSTLDLTIAVERLQGWKEPVEFVLVDPPAGITAEPVVSAEKGDSAKKVTLSIKTAAAWHGPLAVVARRIGKPAEAAPSPLARVRFGKDRLPLVWLSVAP